MRKIVLILVAMLLVSGVAMAQDATAPVTFCGDLSEADCTLLTDAQLATSSLESAAFDLNADFTITGAEGVDGPVSFNLSASGAYSGVSSDMMMMGMDMSSMDPAAMYGAIVEGLRAFSGDLSLTLNFPPELVAQSPDVPESILLELVLVDGVGYINFDPIVEAMGESAEATGMELSGWGGLDIASLLEAVIEQNPEMLTQMDMSGFDPGMYQQFGNMETFSQYATVVRTDDGSGTVATFEMTFDFAGMFSDSAFLELLQQQAEAQGQSMTDEETMQGMEAAQAMFASSSFLVTMSVDTTSGFVSSTSLSFSLDTAAVASEMDSSTAAPVITVNAGINYSQFNDVAEIAPPEGASILPYESLLGMMGGGMTAPVAEATVEAGS